MIAFELVHSRGRFHVYSVENGKRRGRLCACRTEAIALEFVRRDVAVMLRWELDAALAPLRQRLAELESVEIYGLGINAIRSREEHAREIAAAKVKLRAAVRLPTEVEISARMRLVLRRGFAGAYR